jgi:hypothetical protein
MPERTDGRSGEHETELAHAVSACRQEFVAKYAIYGQSWAILRVSSLVDRVWTKAARIRRLEGLKSSSIEPQIAESVLDEYRGIVNYSVMILDRLQHEGLEIPSLGSRSVDRWSSAAKAASSYDSIAGAARELLERKDHDYGGAWRYMRVSTITDEILVRVARVNAVLDSADPDISVLEDQFNDVLNYSLFAIVLSTERGQ